MYIFNIQEIKTCISFVCLWLKMSYSGVEYTLIMSVGVVALCSA